MALTKARNIMIEGAPVNVKDFGAVGDGVTDDTAAIQAMFDFVNKDDNFAHTFTFPRFTTEKGIGEVPAVTFGSGEVYAVSDTIIMSTNVTVDFKGSTLKMLAAGAGKTVLELKYDFEGDGVEAYATQFITIENLKIDGNGFAKVGLLLDRVNWSTVKGVYIAGCTYDSDSYGWKLEECQYSTFTNCYGDANHNGIHLGNAPENDSLRCIDLTFIGCGFNNNLRYGMHISNASYCEFLKLDAGRNLHTDIVINNDNGDGTTSASVNRGLSFRGFKAEHTAADEPSSGYSINNDNGYDLTFEDLNFPQQEAVVTELIGEGSITSGLKTLTITSSTFNANMVGWRVAVSGAGAAGATLTSTIKTYTSPTQVELVTAASTTVAAVDVDILRKAYYKWIRNNGVQVRMTNPQVGSNVSTLMTNPLNIDDVSIFQCKAYNGLRVDFTTWAPGLNQLYNRLAVADDGTSAITSEDNRFTLTVSGNRDSTEYSSASPSTIMHRIGAHSEHYYRPQMEFCSNDFYTTQLTCEAAGHKWTAAGTDEHPVFGVIGAGVGIVAFGDGATALTDASTPKLSNRDSGGALRVESADLQITDGDLRLNTSGYNGNLLRFGGYRLWVDTSGKLRIKAGAPTSDTDGAIVGTQT